MLFFFLFVSCLWPPRAIVLYLSAISIETHSSSVVPSKKKVAPLPANATPASSTVLGPRPLQLSSMRQLWALAGPSPLFAECARVVSCYWMVGTRSTGHPIFVVLGTVELTGGSLGSRSCDIRLPGYPAGVIHVLTGDPIKWINYGRCQSRALAASRKT